VRIHWTSCAIRHKGVVGLVVGSREGGITIYEHKHQKKLAKKIGPGIEDRVGVDLGLSPERNSKLVWATLENTNSIV
jgi:hypothetical protein